MSKFKMGPQGPEGRGWTILLDGVEHKPGILEMRSKYGDVTLGRRPEGYHGFVFQEPGGGGALTLPWVRIDGEIFVGLLLEKRPNLSAKHVLCLMGGILDQGENHKEAQARESSEEGGLDTKKAVEIPGVPFVMNRLYSVADLEAGEGMRAYALKLPASALEQRDDVLCVKHGVVNSKREAELVFLPWKEAVKQSPDSFVLAAIARLLASLDS